MRPFDKVLAVFLVSGLLIPTVSHAEPAKTMTNSNGMEFVLIPAGSFMMGSDKNFDGDAEDHETPLHRVTISKSFYLGKYEVTQAQWVAVMGSNPSNFKGRTNPVEQVSWDDAQQFIRKLNAQEGTSAYRLPTEAEWEYAARAGTETTRYWGDGADEMGQYDWYDGNSGEKTHPVGQLRPNAWGLYGMMGNVSEWCQDWYSDKYYANSPSSDPTGPSGGSYRVRRGGGWYAYPANVRSAIRGGYDQGSGVWSLGFRLSRIYP